MAFCSLLNFLLYFLFTSLDYFLPYFWYFLESIGIHLYLLIFTNNFVDFGNSGQMFANSRIYFVDIIFVYDIASSVMSSEDRLEGLIFLFDLCFKSLHHGSIFFALRSFRRIVFEKFVDIFESGGVDVSRMDELPWINIITMLLNIDAELLLEISDILLKLAFKNAIQIL